MANLVNRLSARQVAWEFGGTSGDFIRVFKVPELIVSAEQDIVTYRTASGAYEIDYLGVWLSFRVSTTYFKEQVSGTACDRIDILNALKSDASITFYPDYESTNDPKPKYEVKSADSTVQLLSTQRGLFKPQQTINMRAIARLDDYPAWLKYK